MPLAQTEYAAAPASAAPAPAARLQRARGAAHVAFAWRDGRTVLADLRQDGCLKLRFPRGAAAEAVLLNSSGGVAAGDRLDIAVAVGAGAAATLSSQAAERFYRARPGDAPAQVRAALTLAAGAALDWLPQETILFDGSALDRHLEVAMDPTARFVGIETLVFGRAAMGEQVRSGRLHDRIRIRRGGRLLLHDAVRLHGPVAALLDRAAVAAGRRAVATLVAVAPDAALCLDALRAALAPHPVEAGASAWDGMLVARMLAADSQSLRRAAVAALDVVRAGRALPRVWAC